MIPRGTITQWGVSRPWATPEQIEQDLLLARTIVAIYSHPVLKKELVFRGGTCLHQAHLEEPLRYSEDLDFVRRTHSGMGAVFDALREVANEVGLAVKGSELGQHPKMRLQAPATTSSQLLRIKVEINTHETAPAEGLVSLPFAVTTDWFTGSAQITTFSLAELVATKLRALYQRSKGRDLFDLWLALEQMALDPDDILRCFKPYRPDNYTADLAISNLRRKMLDQSFRDDLSLLVATWPAGYEVTGAGELVIDQLLSKVPRV